MFQGAQAARSVCCVFRNHHTVMHCIRINKWSILLDTFPLWCLLLKRSVVISVQVGIARISIAKLAKLFRKYGWNTVLRVFKCDHRQTFKHDLQTYVKMSPLKSFALAYFSLNKVTWVFTNWMKWEVRPAIRKPHVSLLFWNNTQKNQYKTFCCIPHFFILSPCSVTACLRV